MSLKRDTAPPGRGLGSGASRRRPARALGALLGLVLLAGCSSSPSSPSTDADLDLAPPDWPQWARDATHSASSPAAAQPLSRVLLDTVYDPLVPELVARSGAVLVHYPVPLLAGNDVFMTFKSGSLTAPMWSEKRLRVDGTLVEELWTFDTDWQPVPGLAWEPVIQPALAGTSVYVPAAGGGLFRVDARTGSEIVHIDPFGAPSGTFVAGPLTVAPDGSILYNALAVDLVDPWGRDVLGSWLVRVSPANQAEVVPYAALAPAAPGPGDSCELTFGVQELPWPPSLGARPPVGPCGSLRAGVNVAPAVGPDGVVITVGRAHLNPRYGYVIALDPDLTPRWAASLRGHLADGCGGPRLPPNGTPGGCRAGAPAGVDPATNAPPAGLVSDLSSSSPVIAPDGSVLYGAYTRYNYARGHLFRFDAAGRFVASFDFGWDITPALYTRSSTWSVVLKDNDYDVGSYCNDAAACPPKGDGPYRITQLSPDLVPEWSSDPAPDEWCINAPAVDAEGTVIGLNEDGHVYTIRQGGSIRDQVMLAQGVGAAYTPLAIAGDGRVVALNYGHLFVVGR
jgi:outer membrane protein assembly factor BamB